jgi:DNA polymerase IV
MLRSFVLDFNSYFASVEQQTNPRLRGRPVGILPVMAESTSCIAASIEAKRFGVKTGTGVREARVLCPEIVFVEARHAVYVEFHHKAVAAVDRIVPVRQVMSIDEMECELTGRWRVRETAIALAQAAKKEILSTVGDQLQTSVGIAPNTLLAKLASNMQKPNGLTVIEQADIPQGLLHLKLQDINGIGKNMLARLNHCGIHSIEALYAAPRGLLHTVWGGMMGDDMYDKIRGQWYAPQETVARSLGHSHVLPPAMRNPTDAFAVLSRLTQKAGMRLRKQGFYATAMSVSLRSDHRFRTSANGHRDTRFGQTQDTAFFLSVLDAFWRDGLALLPQPKAVGMVLHGLVPVAMHTPSLFDAPALNAAAPAPMGLSKLASKPLPRGDRARLQETMDSINKAQGKNALYFATAHGALHHAPMRIAFNRIPDVETEV